MTPPTPTRRLHTLAWAAFLATSWTWCIGMFLPALLVRDFGPWSFVVFALPNILGAGAMGFVLSRQGLSERLVREHLVACRLFSSVTAAFQYFFLGWIMFALGIPAGVLPVALIAAVVYRALWSFALKPINRRERWPAAAVVLLLLSAGIGVALLSLLPWSAPTTTARPPTDLVWLAPVCLFGFALNPYLDLTFHRARQALTPGESRLAFALGFGVIFAAMILMTLLYAPTLIRAGAGEPWPLQPPGVLGLSVCALLAAHLIAQAQFTASAHAASLAQTGKGFSEARPSGRSLLTAVLPFALGFSAAVFNDAYRINGLGLVELVYRSFLAFYGLAFPAYVWTCMIPRRGQPNGPTPAKLRALFLAILFALPFYAAGFLWRETVALIPGVAILLLARVFISRRT